MPSSRDPVPAALRQLGEAIRARRRAAGLSQEKLAELADLDPTFISRVERGLGNISFRNLHRIAAALRLRICDLARRAGV